MDEPKSLIRWLSCLLVCLPLASDPADYCLGQPSSPAAVWKTGSFLDRELERSVTVTWGGATLRSELIQFANNRGIGIFIDRRIDPNTPIDIQILDRTFEQILWILADRYDWSVCRLDDLFYLGPAGVATPLLALWQQQKDRVRRSRTSFHRSGTKTENIVWPFLSEPASVLIDLAERHRFRIVPFLKPAREDHDFASPLPHDLWPTIQLPPLTVDEQVGLLLVGFDLWYEGQATKDTIELIPFPILDSAQIILGPFSKTELSLQDLRIEFPECIIRWERNQFIIQGPFGRLADVNRRLVESVSIPENSLREKKGTAVFTLSNRATRKNLLLAIANNQQLQLRFEGDVRADLDQIVELTVEKVTFEELLGKVLKGSSLKYKISDGLLEIIR